MAKITINHIAMASAIALSIIAGYFSVIGLATIFAGAFLAVLIMGGALETAKVVTVAWLSRNWSNCPKSIKYYLSASVFVLMIITSMGTFGYLSKAHLETNNQVELSKLQIQPLETQLELANKRLDTAQRQIDALDSIVAGVDIEKASRIRNRQARERTALAAQIGDATREIESINTKLLPLRTRQSTIEAELGPLKYVAEMIYGNKAQEYFGSAVRTVIILLVLVFDPLAIVLMIAANYGFKPQGRLRFNKETGKLETLY